MDLAEKLRRHLAIQKKTQKSFIQGENLILEQLERLRTIQEKKRQEAGLKGTTREGENFGGEVRQNSAGSFLCFCNTVSNPQDKDSFISPSSSESVASLIELLQGKNRDVDPSRILFLDTETTGLSGGTGTYAFLVGVGSWGPEGFQVEQYFMRDFHEERAMLVAVEERFSQAQTVVTFNGKRFDLPLLESRFVLARFPWPLQSVIHLDLLYPARRLWKLRLGDCSLGRLEKEILGISRESDVPGQLIPSLYFNYTHTGVARGIRNILDHNRQDIVSLAALAQVVSRVLTAAQGIPSLPGEDLFSAGKYFRYLGRQQVSVEFSRAALEKDLPDEVRLEAMERLAALYKSEGLYSQAVTLWETVVANSSDAREETWENLAVYCEHSVRNLPRALELTQQVLDRLVRESTGPSRMEKWAHRQQRLKKKIQKGG
jgi:uncharacterized protein YprB with RNaseH-like and TPR domain